MLRGNGRNPTCAQSSSLSSSAISQNVELGSESCLISAGSVLLGHLPKLVCCGFVSRSILPTADKPRLLLGPERPGMEFHGLAHVRQEVSQAMVARIKVILMLNALGLELPV